MGDTNNQDNDTNSNIALIKDALGNPDGCDVDFDVEESVSFYTIRPKDAQGTPRINSMDIARINHLNLQFEKCIFENEILFKKFEFNAQVHFRECRFSKIVDFSNAILNNSIGFVKSIFEQKISFKEAIFNEGIYFCESISKGSVDFSHSSFNGATDFSGITFEQKALFIESLFNKKAIFNDVKFGDTESAKGYVSFSNATFKDKAEFSRAHFQYEAVFQATHFEDVLDFDDSVFMDKVDFQTANFCNRATFNNTIFQTKANSQDSGFKGHVSFSNTIFNDNVEFEDAKFLQRVFFKKTHFKKDVSFSNSIFQEANFFQSNFYQNAYFYGATFQKFPNFLQVIFKGNISFINTELDFGFESTRERIETLYNEEDNEHDSQSNQNKKEFKKYRIANEFRDSFRIIKSALIKDNNMLDASNYHRIELYCKELELEHKRKEKAKGFWENLKFLLSNGKDFIDEIQLYCYRLTSDHHTNLLMILNNVIFLIALFGIMKCFLKHNYMSEALACIVFVIISISFLLCPKLTSEETCNKYSKIVNNNFVFILLYVIPAIFLGYTLFNHYTSSACLSCVIFAIFILYAIFYNTIIETIALAFAYLVSKKRNCILFLAYGMTIYMLFTTPASILPILGKLIENKSAETCLFVIGKVKILCCGGASSTPETLNLIYMLFLFLLLWSLQKTARKNTIVPN